MQEYIYKKKTKKKTRFWNNNINNFKWRNEWYNENCSSTLRTLGASSLENLLTGKGIVRAGSGNKKGKGIVRTGTGNKGKGIVRAGTRKQ